MGKFFSGFFIGYLSAFIIHVGGESQKEKSKIKYDDKFDKDKEKSGSSSSDPYSNYSTRGY